MLNTIWNYQTMIKYGFIKLQIAQKTDQFLRID